MSDSARTEFSGNVTTRSRELKRVGVGLAYLAPNILGFLAFTFIPLLVAIVMAFTNWDLKLHNAQLDQQRIEQELEPWPIRFVGLENFSRLLVEPDFYRFLGNTLFFMLGLPISIAASLGVAMLLSRDLRGSKIAWTKLVIGGATIVFVLMIGSAVYALMPDAPSSAMLLLLAGVVSLIVLGGAVGGSTVYRTLLYIPNFTSGVATYLLWKKLFNPTSGPLTTALSGPVEQLERTVNALPSILFHLGGFVLTALALLLTMWAVRALRRQWEDGEIGLGSLFIGIVALCIPIVMTQYWFESIDFQKLLAGNGFWFDHAEQLNILGSIPTGFERYIQLRETSYDLLGKCGGFLLVAMIVVLAWQSIIASKSNKRFVTKQKLAGAGSAIMFTALIVVGVCILIGLAGLLIKLPAMAIEVPGRINPDGLRTPNWLTDIKWAKPSIMLMSFWAAIGSNNMLLYLAALSNVPVELNEAADIDGATKFQRFWNITWPQLAPTTFFIVILGVIGGLQGGFEMAKVMTNGEPAGQTVTLSYFIYNQGFVTGALGYSSAISWMLFLMVFVVTIFNLKFGSRFVNE